MSIEQPDDPYLQHTWMPEFTPPWEDGVLGKLLAPNGVREEYAVGLWGYAVGYPAATHPRYGEAVDMWLASTDITPWWIRSVADVDAVLHGCRFEPRRGLRVAQFIGELRMPSLRAGECITLMDWELFDFLMPLYSWVRPNRFRRFSKFGLWIPKKNGKSGIASPQALYHLRGEDEPNPYVWLAATNRGQTRIIYDASKGIVELTPDLSKDLIPAGGEVAGIKIIVYPAAHGRLEALPEDAKSVEGKNSNCGLFDEIHVGSKLLWSALAGSGATRDEPILGSLSTAGIYDPGSIGLEQWQYALGVANGSIQDDSFLSLVYRCLPVKDNAKWWDSIEVARKANPSLGVILKESFIQDRLTEARQSPEKVNALLRYHFNVWVHQAESLIAMDKWKACATRMSLADYEESLAGCRCYGGLDLSSSNDLTAFAMWFPQTLEYGKHRCLVDFFLPRESLKKLADDISVSYLDWADAGLIHLTEGPIINYEYVRSQIDRRMEQFNIQQIGFDKYNASETVNMMVQTHGDEFMVDVPQGMLTMGPAARFLMEHIDAATLEHPNHAILNWNAGNAQAHHANDQSGRYMIAKIKGGLRCKVDGLVALTIAGSRVLACVGEDEVRTEGIFFV